MKLILELEKVFNQQPRGITDFNASLNKSWAWHVDGATNKKIHMIFIKY